MRKIEIRWRADFDRAKSLKARVRFAAALVMSA